MAPLVELTDTIEQADNKLASDINTTLVCRDLIDCLDGVDNNERIHVTGQLVKLLEIISVSLEPCFIHVE